MPAAPVEQRVEQLLLRLQVARDTSRSEEIPGSAGARAPAPARIRRGAGCIRCRQGCGAPSCCRSRAVQLPCCVGRAAAAAGGARRSGSRAAGAPGAPMDRGELVHDPAAHADILVLGLLARARKLRPAGAARVAGEGESAATSSAAEELRPGAERHVADIIRSAPTRAAARLQRPRDPADVVHPVRGRRACRPSGGAVRGIPRRSSANQARNCRSVRGAIAIVV